MQQTTQTAGYGGGALAYLGDAVFEVLVRERLVKSGVSDPGKLNAMALSYVRATAQSAGLERLLPHLSAQEEADFRRGRNGAGAHPKSATGLEALFGALYLRGEAERAKELFLLYAEGVEAKEAEHA